MDKLTDNNPVDETKPLSVDDIFAELNKDEPEAEDDILKLDEDEPKDEKKEPAKEEDEEELKVEDEELELVTPAKKKEILAKYPTLFKDFPHLERAYYRDQQFTDLFGTPEDAKETVARSKEFEKFEESLLKDGTPAQVLTSVKDADPKAFAKIVDNYLPALYQADQTAYYHVLGNMTTRMIYGMAQEAQRLQNNELLQAAHMLNQFVFGTGQYVPPQNFSKETTEQDNSVKKEREEFLQERFDTIKEDVGSRVSNNIRNTIANNMDPKSSMSEYVKTKAVEDCQKSLDDLLAGDKHFQTIYERLWEKAAESNFSKESTDKIRAAYLAKAKSLLPDLIKRTRNQALRGLKSNGRDESIDRRGPLPVGKSASPISSGQKGSSSAIPKGMSTVDFLMSED